MQPFDFLLFVLALIKIDLFSNYQLENKMSSSFSSNSQQSSYSWQETAQYFIDINEDDFKEAINTNTIIFNDPLFSAYIYSKRAERLIRKDLFGFKTELQFGYLRLTGVASQQKSQRQNIKVQGWGQVQQFAVFADQYDENRHFFLSHINRQLFEGAMKNLPQVNTQIKITDLDVWVTNDRNEPNSVRDVLALADLELRPLWHLATPHHHYLFAQAITLW